MKQRTGFFLTFAAGFGAAASLFGLTDTPADVAAPTPVPSSSGAVTVSEIVSVYDGDTFTVHVAGWPAVLGRKLGIRVNGVDTPEMRGGCPEEKAAARRAKEAARDFLRNAQTVVLHNLKRGKYFRVVADVTADGRSLAAMLLKEGHARPYDGGKKQPWCNSHT